jgi:CRISPR-associated protein Cmr1
MNGHLPLDKLREEEAKIFGGTGDKEGKSKFSIVVSGNVKTSSGKFPNHPVQVSSKGRSFKINILEYLAYGTLEYIRGKGNVFIRDYIPSGETFKVTLIAQDQQILNTVKEVFVVTVNFSGYGSKSRNGFGHIALRDSAGKNISIFNYSTFKDRYKKVNLFSYTGFSREMRILKTRNNFNTWDKALAELGKAYRSLRGEGKFEPKHQYEKRQYIGAPIVVNKQTKSFLERRAKPLFLHVSRTNNGSFNGYIFYLPSEYCTGLDLDRNNDRINHPSVNSKFLQYSREFVDLLAKDERLIEI